MKQIPLAIGALGAGPEQTFDNYLCAANAPAVAHLRGLGEHAAPVYLWGPQGSGKTHLLHALTRRVQGQGGQVGWFCSRDALPWVHDEQRSLVVLDGCDLFDAPRQQAAFALFAQAAASGIGVVAAGRLPPVDLPLREDLRTRLAWGHVFALQPPAEAERRAVLRREADRRAVFLSDELMDYVLARFDRDLKALMDLVDRLDRFSLANKRAITVPMLKRMLAEDGATPRAAGRGLTLFDLDHTLLPIDSDHAWGEFLAANAWVDGDEFRRQNDHFFAQYQAGRLDIDAYVMSATAPLRSRSPADARALHARFMHEVIVPRLQPQALALVNDHQARGDAIALVTATNDFVTAPIAAALGIDTLIAVRLARDAAGQVTGHIDGTPSYREGKVTRVEQWLATSGRTWADFDRISVYSDSMNDLPLLERATDPVATNPSPQLEALALLRGWRILRLFA